MSSKYCRHTVHVRVCSSFSWLFTRLDDILGQVARIKQGSSRAVSHAFGTIDTSGDETEGSEPRKRVRSKRTYRMKKVWGG